MATGNWGPLRADLWAWVPRAHIPYRKVDKSTVNKEVSIEGLFMTGLFTRPLPPVQLSRSLSLPLSYTLSLSHTQTHTHAHVSQRPPPRMIDVPISLCQERKKLVL